MDPIIVISLAVLLSATSVTDYRGKRIPNILTLPAMVAGLSYHAVTHGLDGLAFAATGLAVGLGVMLLPFLLSLMGGGDVKLMAAVGSWLGANDVFTAFLFTCLCGGVYSVAMLARGRLFRRVFENIKAHVYGAHATGRLAYQPALSGAEAQALPRLCYGLAIAAGTMLSMAVTAWIRAGKPGL